MDFKRLKKYIFSKYKMVFIDLTFEEDRVLDNPDGITFERFQRKDIKSLNKIMLQRDFRSDFDINEAIDRLNSGFLLYVIKSRNEIIGYDWYAVKSFYIKFLDASLELKKYEVYGVFTFINKDYRGRGLLNGLHSYANYDLKRLGYKRVLANYSPLNLAMKRALTKFGYETIGEVTHGYIATIRYMLNNIPKDKLTLCHSPFSFYKRLYKKFF